MAVLVFAENSQGRIKKGALEAVSYAYAFAELLGEDLEAVVLGETDSNPSETLGRYGVKKVFHYDDADLNDFNDQLFTAIVADLVKEEEIPVIVMAQSYDGKALAPRLAARLDAALVSGAVQCPVKDDNGFTVRRSANSGKGIETVLTHRDTVIISVKKNSFGLNVNEADCEVEEVEYDIDMTSSIKIVERVQTTSKVSITEADIVISGGRGFKGPENWGILEEFAEAVGAGTACSKPVSDMDWRPHHEHVGQTGIQIAPNLYIAVGISGAIQHLAGVNSSKNIVVINKDPEAPFFKHADYGIIGDLFEVLPKINEAVRKHKASQA